MSTTRGSPPSTSSGNKPRWAMVSVLGVAVLALGAALVYIQARPPEPLVAVLPTEAPGGTPASPPASAPAAAALPVDKGNASAPTRSVAPANHAAKTTKPAASTP